MDRTKDIIEIIAKMSGKYSEYEVFSDWIKCMALSIANNSTLRLPKEEAIWQKREQEYLGTIKRYNKEEQDRFSEMLYLLCESLEEPRDVLNAIYMGGNMGSKSTGQFFTPFHISEACARMVVPQEAEEIKPIYEPSCGSGGMIIAVAKVMAERGINYQRKMDVVAQDLDWKAVYMCYVQLSLLGIKAIVVQGDTLAEPYTRSIGFTEKTFVTPAKRGMLL